jgi:hypothetical protein
MRGLEACKAVEVHAALHVAFSLTEVCRDTGACRVSERADSGPVHTAIERRLPSQPFECKTGVRSPDEQSTSLVANDVLKRPLRSPLSPAVAGHLAAVGDRADRRHVHRQVDGRCPCSVRAQFDNDVRSDRTRAGMKAALELGRWVFLARFSCRTPRPAVGEVRHTICAHSRSARCPGHLPCSRVSSSSLDG